MNTRTVTSAALLTIFVAKACGGNGEQDAATATPVPESTTEAETDIEALIERENQLFSDWLVTEAGTPEKAELDETYPELQDFDPETASEVEMPEELQGLALWQYVNEGE